MSVHRSRSSTTLPNEPTRSIRKSPSFPHQLGGGFEAEVWCYTNHRPNNGKSSPTAHGSFNGFHLRRSTAIMSGSRSARIPWRRRLFYGVRSFDITVACLIRVTVACLIRITVACLIWITVACLIRVTVACLTKVTVACLIRVTAACLIRVALIIDHHFCDDAGAWSVGEKPRSPHPPSRFFPAIRGAALS